MKAKVDTYISTAEEWRAENEKLSHICLDCQLTEELRWRLPCYNYQGWNVVIIQSFDEFFALLFFKGTLLKDIDGILVKPRENTQARRQMRFSSVQVTTEMESGIKAYIREAIDVDEAGLAVET